MPTIFEVHSHEGGGSVVPAYLGPGTVACVSLLGFFIFEKCLNLFYFHKELKKKDSPYGSDKSDEETELEPLEEGLTEKAEKTSVVHAHSQIYSHHIKPVGWLNLFADGFHNFTDGLSIGISFATGSSTGLATTVAVFFHEIPQELGDFAILLSAGFTKKKALLFNFLSATVAILGTIIGLSIGSEADKSEKWLLAIVAGGFFYIALADMLPELADKFRVKNIIRQSLAILFGMGLMLLIALMEKEQHC